MRTTRTLTAAIVTVATTAAIAGYSASAHAQTTDATLRVQKPFRIKVGAFLPTDGDLRDIVGSPFLSYGVSYDFAKTRSTNPAVYSIFVNGATRNRSRDVELDGDVYDADVRVTYTGVGPSIRAYFNPPTRSTRLFGGLGIGAYFVSRRVGVSVEDVTVSTTENDTRFGGKIFGGLELDNGLFAEADYTYIGELDGLSLNGVNLSLGFRF